MKEVIAPLLAGEVVIDGSTRGWMFHYSTLSKKQLARLKEKTGYEWTFPSCGQPHWAAAS
ncbi:hypothetical protein [Rhizobium sp. PL01]|uniref:hypothetical protein n=1 Tax=Rhizobium sp. PL01 TaxID=3085631 RepID=UPI0029825DAF|nr:hypothetical protein [Rhizobium sp. PL01]MDW5317143.1 hypothetical protein [Rhizobium sp. PL01]